MLPRDEHGRWTRPNLIVAPFEDRMQLAYEAARLDRERRGYANRNTIAAVVDDWSTDPEDFMAMFETVFDAVTFE